MIKRFFGVTLISATVALVGCSSSDDNTDPVDMTDPGVDYTLFAPVDGDGNAITDTVSTLLAASNVGLTNALANESIVLDDTKFYTIFAPTDDALTAASVQGDGGALDPDETPDVSAILLYHVVEGNFTAAADLVGTTQLTDGAVLTTLNGKTATFDAVTDGFTFGGAAITGTDTFGSNGVIHTLGAVAVPPADTTPDPDPDPDPVTGDSVFALIANNTSTAQFRAGLEGANGAGLNQSLADEAQTWTVFAPTDAAMTAYTAGGGTIDLAFFQRHLVAGSSFTVAEMAAVDTGIPSTFQNQPIIVTATSAGGFNIAEADLVGSNGTVHVIEGVIE